MSAQHATTTGLDYQRRANQVVAILGSKTPNIQNLADQMNMSVPTTYVLGLGNVLMSDDGLGPAAVRAFEAEYVVGPDVTVIDLGTPGLDLMPSLADADRVIGVDTVTCDLAPGTLRIYDKRDVMGICRRRALDRTTPA